MCYLKVAAISLFEANGETEAIILLGDIGGCFEEDVAKVIEMMRKPVLAYVVGQNAPAGKK